MKRCLPLLVLAVACEQDKIELGQGGDSDARLIADVYTWQCEDRNYDPGDPEYYYEGVFSYNISFEYAPDNLATRELPVSGCTKGLDLFPASAGDGGRDLPEAGEPDWSNGEYAGVLARKAEGFYYDDATGNVDNCSYPEDMIGDGTVIAEAGVFSGASAPESGALGDVTISSFSEETGIEFGAEVSASWSVKGWDDAWVQVRRESMGELVESVTCAVDGSSLTIGAAGSADDNVWSLMTSVVEADVTNLYIAVQNEKEVEAEDGQVLVALTREIHAAVVR